MPDHVPAPSYSEVLAIVERRRRTRRRARATAGSALAVAGISLTGLAAVVIPGGGVSTGEQIPPAAAPARNSNDVGARDDVGVPDDVGAPDDVGVPDDVGPSPDGVGTSDGVADLGIDPEIAMVIAGVTDEQAAVAFADAGYSDRDALQLGVRWQTLYGFVPIGERTLPESARLVAGAYLLQGVSLADIPYAVPVDVLEFFSEDDLLATPAAYGYQPADMVRLELAWGGDPSSVDLRAGVELKRTGVLPFVDRTLLPGEVDGRSIDHFYAAGYDYDDAVVLASLWYAGDASPEEVMAEAGDVIKEGRALMAIGSASAGAGAGLTENDLVARFFEMYEYGDADRLALYWGVGVDEAAVRAGREHVTVGVLPWVSPVS